MIGNTLRNNDYIVNYGNYSGTHTEYDKEDVDKIIVFKTGNVTKFDTENLLYYPGVTKTDIVTNIAEKERIRLLEAINIENEKEMVIMRNKLRNCVPVHTIIYLVATSISFSVSLLLVILRYSKNLYIIDPYYLFCAVIISIGLFLTAVTSIKDWKEHMIGEKEK